MLQKLFTASLLTVGLLLTGPIFSPNVFAQEAASVGVGDTSLDLSGHTSPGAYVTIRNNTAVVGALTADNAGNFSQLFPAQDPGITQLSMFARDTANRITDTVNLQVNLQEHFPTAVQVFLPTSLSLSSPLLVAGQSLQLRGQTLPLGIVAVWLDNQNIATVTAAADGSWSYSLNTTGLEVGTHQVFAGVIDSLGSQSYPTSPYSFALSPVQSSSQSSPTSTKPFPFLLQLAAPHIISPTKNEVLHNADLTITGNGPAHTQIEVWDEARVLGSVWSDYHGGWSLPLTFAQGTFSLRARACADNFCGPFSPTVAFTYQARQLSQQKLQATINHSTITKNVNDRTVFQLQIQYGNTPYQVFVDWGDGSSKNTELNKNNTVLEHIYHAAGRYSGHVTISDGNGKQELRFTVNVKDVVHFSSQQKDLFSNLWQLTLITMTLWIIRLLFKFWHHKKYPHDEKDNKDI